MINFDDLEFNMLYSNINKDSMENDYYDAIMKTIEKIEKKGASLFLSNEKLVYALVHVYNSDDDVISYYCLALKADEVTNDFIINTISKIESSSYLFAPDNITEVFVSVDSIVDIKLTTSHKFSFKRLNVGDIVLSSDDFDNYNL